MTTAFQRNSSAIALVAALALGLSAPSFAQDSATSSETTDPIMGVEGADPAPAAGEDSDGSSAAQSDMPSNEVGEKFELPRYSEGNQVELISGLCAIQMKNMSEQACTCLADEALTGLSDPQRDYLIASVVAPPVSDRMLNDGRVNESDQAEIFGFLETYSETCREQTASSGGSSTMPESSTSGGSSTSATPSAEDEPGPGPANTEETDTAN